MIYQKNNLETYDELGQRASLIKLFLLFSSLTTLHL